MKENKDKQFYLTVKNTITGKEEKVFVTEEVYRAYKKPIHKEQSRKRREDRCLVRNKYGNLIRCTADCKICEYYLSGQKPGVNGLSLDVFKEQGLEIADPQADLESEYIRREETQRLREACALLSPVQQELLKLFFIENKGQAEIASIMGVSQQAISKAIAKIKDLIKKYFENF